MDNILLYFALNTTIKHHHNSRILPLAHSEHLLSVLFSYFIILIVTNINIIIFFIIIITIS